MGEFALLDALVLLVAAGAALARAADGTLAIPFVFAAVMQASAVLLHLRRLGGPKCANGDRWIFGIVLIGAIAAAVHRRTVDAFFICTTAFLVGRGLLLVCVGIAGRIESSLDRPGGLVRILFPVWLASVLVATVLLAIPLGTQSGVPDYRHNFWLHVSNCLFSAASAGSLVGTGVYGFAEDFSLFGQIVLMVETQLCGMAFAALGLAIVRPMLLRDVSLRAVWLTGVGLELAAIVILYGQWHSSDAGTMLSQIGWSAVHAISAMWNSGFTMKPSGLAEYLGQGRVFASITVLVIVGSLGIPVVLDLVAFRKPIEDQSGRPLKRLAGWDAGVAFVLLLGVATALFLCETPRLLSGRFFPTRPFEMGGQLVPMRDEPNHAERWRTAVFVSATLRSAGMQSIPMSTGAISWPSFGTVLGAMIIGGSAGGTGGGLRTSTITLMMICLLLGRSGWAMHPGGAGGRSQLLKRLVLFASGWLAMNVCAVLLLAAVTEGTWYEWSMESVAALSNVSISTGLSLHLTPAGRLTMIGLMMLGRWLPLAFWLQTSALIAASRVETDTKRAARRC